MDDWSEAADVAATPIVTMAREIDITNCDQAAADLAMALASDARAVIADMTQTTFCDSSAVRALLQAHKLAVSQGSELRLVVSARAVLRTLELTGLTSTFLMYPDVAAAMGDGHRPARTERLRTDQLRTERSD